jgi:hypothetical protein
MNIDQAKPQLMQMMYNIHPMDNQLHALWLLVEKIPSKSEKLPLSKLKRLAI